MSNPINTAEQRRFERKADRGEIARVLSFGVEADLARRGLRQSDHLHEQHAA